MNKQEFLARLNDGLSGLPQADAKERLTFYSEMIDDRMEDGLSEEEAVAEIGSVDAIAAQLIEETPVSSSDKEKRFLKRRLRAWEIVLLVLGSPLWLSVLALAFAAVLTLCLTVWVVILTLWVVELALIGGFFGGLVEGVWFLIRGGIHVGGFQQLALFGVGLVLAGLSVFWFFGCRAATKGAWSLKKRIVLRIKSSLAERRLQHETGH